MSLITSKMQDFTEPLKKQAQEDFVKEYIRLDVDCNISHKRTRRIKAYRFAYPDAKAKSDSIINDRAVAVLKLKTVVDRMRFLYSEIGSSIEAEVNWTASKSEDALLAIVFDEETKSADKLKAIQQLNMMRGIDKPQIEKEEDGKDTVEEFFSGLANTGSDDNA